MACNIDHSLQDVQNKLQSQKDFLPKELHAKLTAFLSSGSLSQNLLNEIFHLLKKYDLSEADEQQRRNEALEKLISA